MGLWSWLFGQFIDVIEWVDNSQDTMVYRFNRHGNEIKYGAKLIVRESQVAVFVSEGEIADILTPGTYELETKNIPILTSLQHWDHGFSSPFKAEVYFFNTKRFTNIKWGTKNPIMVRDAEFSMVRLRAFGTYEVRISDPKKLIKEIVGTDGHFSVDEIKSQLSNLIVTKFAITIGNDSTPILDMAGAYGTFGEYMREKVSPYFAEYGLDLLKVLVENISLPPEVEAALDRRSSREITGDLNANILYQSGQALENGGGASDMVGMGAGLAMGQQMADAMRQTPNTATPPKLPLFYYVALEGKQHGPYDIDTIRSKMQEGTITPQTLMWHEGLANWQPANLVLKDSFSTPPPLPKV